MLSVNGEDVRLMLWDTAGQEEFDCITRAYYRYLFPPWTFIYWTYYWKRRDQKDERLKRPGNNESVRQRTPKYCKSRCKIICEKGGRGASEYYRVLILGGPRLACLPSPVWTGSLSNRWVSFLLQETSIIDLLR